MASASDTCNKDTATLAQSGELHPWKVDWGNREGSSRKRVLTEDEKQRIRDLYAKHGNGHEVAQLMGLGSSTVYKHLGLNKCKHPKWDDDDLQVLVDGYLEKRPTKDIAKQLDRPTRAVTTRMCRYRKQVKKDPKKRRALSAISLAFKAVKKADIFRELEE